MYSSAPEFRKGLRLRSALYAVSMLPCVLADAPVMYLLECTPGVLSLLVEDQTLNHKSQNRLQVLKLGYSEMAKH